MWQQLIKKGTHDRQLSVFLGDAIQYFTGRQSGDLLQTDSQGFRPPQGESLGLPTAGLLHNLNRSAPVRVASVPGLDPRCELLRLVPADELEECAVLAAALLLLIEQG